MLYFWSNSKISKGGAAPGGALPGPEGFQVKTDGAGRVAGRGRLGWRSRAGGRTWQGSAGNCQSSSNPHPTFSVTLQSPCCPSPPTHQELRDFARSQPCPASHTPPQARHQVLEMEEESTIDRELRELRFRCVDLCCLHFIGRVTARILWLWGWVPARGGLGWRSHYAGDCCPPSGLAHLVSRALP